MRKRECTMRNLMENLCLRNLMEDLEDLCLIGKLIDERVLQMQTMKLFEQDANRGTYRDTYFLDKVREAWMLEPTKPFDPYKSENAPFIVIRTPEFIKELMNLSHEYEKLDSIKWSIYELGPKEMVKFVDFKAPRTVPGMGVLEYVIKDYDGPRGRKNYHV